MKSLFQPLGQPEANREWWATRAWMDGAVRDPPPQSQKCNSLSKTVCTRAQFDMNICDALLYRNIC